MYGEEMIDIKTWWEETRLSYWYSAKTRELPRLRGNTLVEGWKQNATGDSARTRELTKDSAKTRELTRARTRDVPVEKVGKQRMAMNEGELTAVNRKNRQIASVTLSGT